MNAQTEQVFQSLITDADLWSAVQAEIATARESYSDDYAETMPIGVVAVVLVDLLPADVHRNVRVSYHDLAVEVMNRIR